MRRILIRIGIVLAVLALLAIAGYLILFPPYQPLTPTGSSPWATEIREYDTGLPEPYVSNGSTRKLSVLYYYPTDRESASCPLVVFSHGAMGFKTSNESLYRELASHGYVVASIDHTYQCLSTKIGGKTIRIDGSFMKALQTEDAKTDPANSYACYQQWMDVRMGDIDFVIDMLTASPSPEDFSRLIDPARIGVMGHSLGGSAALGMGRVRDNVKAVIALESPFMYDVTGVEDGAFTWDDAPYPIPMLNIYTDSSYAKLEALPQYKQNANYLNSDREDVKNVYLPDTGHFSITDLALSSPILTRILNGMPGEADRTETLRIVSAECLSFFDQWLK